MDAAHIALATLADFFAIIQSIAAKARILQDALDAKLPIDPGDFDLVVSRKRRHGPY